MNEQEQRIAIAKACGWKKIITLNLPIYGAWGNSFPSSHRDTSVGIAPFDVSKYPREEKFYGENVIRVRLPDYLNDLNAIYEAENILFEKNDWRIIRTYFDLLSPNIHKDDSMDEDDWKLCHATAKQRAEAFLRTLGLWKD